MSEADLEEVKQIEKESDISIWSLLDYKSEIKRKDGLALVAKEDSKIIGFIIARLIRFRNPTIKSFDQVPARKKLLGSLPILETETEIEIYNIAVKHIYQNQGVGQRLLNRLIDDTATFQSRSIWLEVRESNKNAIKFYKKNKFTEINKRKDFYNNPIEDGIVMKKFLKS